ncbi:Hsp20/alpha crystallin family protein [Neoroseomonas rubea]|uniref:Hsp20/alpha crystallin family protein n=1 Tax=Neoroseomonas rubea TaxID=2748666 RepID=UPI0018E02FDA
MNRVFDQMFGGALAPAAGFAPSVEMKETAQGVSVTAELPGLEEKDIEISLDGDLLTLSGEKRAETTEEKEGVHISERSYGSFRRTLRLPWSPDPAKVAATFEKGVLSVTLPRPAEAKPTVNRIPIAGASAKPAG